MLLFRWSVWGPNIQISMLTQSIGTFRRFFAEQARYVVFTDNRQMVLNGLKVEAEVFQFDQIKDARYMNPAATWLKWAPICRYDRTITELRIDADMFLVAEPAELRAFCSSDNHSTLFLSSMENFTALWPYGNFASHLPADFTPINAGLIGQYAGADLSPLLAAAYHWWETSVPLENVKYHDEQGAVAAILQPLIKQGKVTLLPPERYQVVCPLNVPAVDSLNGIVLLHATYPDHPAFYQFQTEISQISGIPIE